MRTPEPRDEFEQEAVAVAGNGASKEALRLDNRPSSPRLHAAHAIAQSMPPTANAIDVIKNRTSPSSAFSQFAEMEISRSSMVIKLGKHFFNVFCAIAHIAHYL